MIALVDPETREELPAIPAPDPPMRSLTGPRIWTGRHCGPGTLESEVDLLGIQYARQCPVPGCRLGRPGPGRDEQRHRLPLALLVHPACPYPRA